MEMRVARALKDGTGLLIAPSFWDKCAKIAIRAMREPTQEMINALVDKFDLAESAMYHSTETANGAAEEIWEAVIDAASPPKTKP